MPLLNLILLPFSWLYGSVLWFRNKLYDWQVLSSYRPDVLSISIGNLIAGGSGKTPMIMYLIEKYAGDYRVGVLSRGYGRRSSGFRWVNTSDTADVCGDEPLMIKRKFPDVEVAVCENRKLGIEQMVSTRNIDLLLLDDAFQHRKVNPHVQIILSAYDRPFFNDFPLPAGRLREFRAGSARADAIVFTKAPANISESERNRFTSNVKLKREASVFFAEYRMTGNTMVNRKDLSGKITLVTGIAYADSLLQHIQSQRETVHINFGDHHHYTFSDFKKIESTLHKNSLVLTTSKDWVKWQEFKEVWKNWNIAVVEQEIHFLPGSDFDDFLRSAINKHGKSKA